MGSGPGSIVRRDVGGSAPEPGAEDPGTRSGRDDPPHALHQRPAMLVEAASAAGIASRGGPQTDGGAEPAADQRLHQRQHVDRRRLGLDLAATLGGPDLGELVPVGAALGRGGLRSLEVTPADDPQHARVGCEVVEHRARVAGQIGGVERHRVVERDDDAADDLIEDLFLIAEVDVEQTLVGARALRDPIDPRSGEAVLGELIGGGLEQQLLGRLDVARRRAVVVVASFMPRSLRGRNQMVTYGRSRCYKYLSS